MVAREAVESVRVVATSDDDDSRCAGKKGTFSIEKVENRDCDWF